MQASNWNRRLGFRNLERRSLRHNEQSASIGPQATYGSSDAQKAPLQGRRRSSLQHVGATSLHLVASFALPDTHRGPLHGVLRVEITAASKLVQGAGVRLQQQECSSANKTPQRSAMQGWSLCC